MTDRAALAVRFRHAARVWKGTCLAKVDVSADVCDLDVIAEALEAATHVSTPAQDEMILIPKAALDWLFGQGPDEKGWHFGECREAQKAMNTKNPRRYWWRSKFRKMCNYPSSDTRLKIED